MQVDAKLFSAELAMPPTLPSRPTLTLDATPAPNIRPGELAPRLLSARRATARVAAVDLVAERGSCTAIDLAALLGRDIRRTRTPTSKERCSHR